MNLGPTEPVPGQPETPKRLRKADRIERIVLELKLRPHVRISEMAALFGVSTETIRRDMSELSAAGLIDREHGGASAPRQGYHPSFGERSRARLAERERIGQMAASLVEPGQTLMIDSGSTTFQMARLLSYSGTPCTVLTNSLEIATVLGGGGQCEVILCPGDFLSQEAAVIGTETVQFLSRHWVDACFIGASALFDDGVFETVAGFSAVKRAMLGRCNRRHLLTDAEKFGRRGLREIAPLERLDFLVTDRHPGGTLGPALDRADVRVLVAEDDMNQRLIQREETQ